MIIHNHEQRSPEWYACRLGLPTASSFDKIVTSKGEPSAQRQKYLYKLAGEKLGGEREENFVSPAMQHGIDTEEEARKVYELVSCETVEKVGLCISSSVLCSNYGASPDGLVGKDGILEIKCPKVETHVEYLINNKLPTDYIQQVQGQLLVTGRKWCDFMSYSRGLNPLIIRVERDEAFIEKLENELRKFNNELTLIINKIKD